MTGAHPTNASINDMTYNPPSLPDYLSRTHNLTIIVGVPTDDEVKVIHDTVRAVNSVSNIPALYDHKLSTQLAQYLFTIQMAVYRNEYPSNVFPVEHTYTPPPIPSHIPISLEPVTGAPSDEELESVHGVIRAMDNLANSPFFDSALNVKLSQHLFNIQFARYIEDSNQGHFTQRPPNPPPSSRTNEHEHPVVTPVQQPEIPDEGEPRDVALNERGSDSPTLSQQARLGYDISDSAPISQSIDEKTDKFGIAHRIEETNQLLRVISRTLFSTHFDSHRSSDQNYNSYKTMNDKGELPWMHNLPDIYSSDTNGIQEQNLVPYLRFYGIGAELIEEGSANLKPGKLRDAQKLLGDFLYHGCRPTSQST